MAKAPKKSKAKPKTKARPEATAKAKRKPKPRRKNMFIDQAGLDAARAILASATETQTVEEAIDGILFAEEVIFGLRGLAEIGGLEYFDERDRPQK